jgi:outer membrane protein OmpA-like peptidoglycan-associated protein
MRTVSLVLALSCAGTAALVLPAVVPLPAHAQASIDPRALEPLQPAPAAPKPATGEAAKPATPHHKHSAHPAASHPAGTTRAPGQTAAKPPAAQPNATPHPATPAGSAAAAPVAPTTPRSPAAAAAPTPSGPAQVRVPLTAPPAPVVPPPLIVPTRPPAPPAPAPVAADAPGAPAPIQDGLRVTFGEGRADLNPGTETALRTLAHDAPTETSFTVAAFAPGAPEDPSTPRRLSLSRALTARAVLIAAGIPSVRIYVKALGASRGVEEGPADRVDVTLDKPAPQARSPQ